MKSPQNQHIPGPSGSNRYYLMRHGESLANRRGIIVSKPENAVDDYGLTTKGAEQAMQAALKTRLGRETIIVSSDYKRARETAEIMHGVLACSNPILFSEQLRERRFGEWELQDHCNYETVWQNDINQPSKCVRQVETVDETLQRGLRLIEELNEQFNKKAILLVGHGDVLQILLAHHHSIHPRFHRSLSNIGNADIRSLSKLELATNITPAA